MWSGIYRRYGQGAAEHAAAASEVVLVLSLSSLPDEGGNLWTAGAQWTACGGQSCAGDAESRYFRAFSTGAGRAASRSKQTGDRRQAQMAGNKQTRPGGGGLGNEGACRWTCGRPGERELWSGEVVSFRATLFFSPSSLAYAGRLAVSLYYVKRTSQARGTGNRTGSGTAARKDCRGPVQCMWSLSNETWCYPRYPCAGVAQGVQAVEGPEA